MQLQQQLVIRQSVFPHSGGTAAAFYFTPMTLMCTVMINPSGETWNETTKDTDFMSFRSNFLKNKKPFSFFLDNLTNVMQICYNKIAKNV